MRVLAIVHQRDAGPGTFADAAAARGDELVEWVPAERPPPAAEGLDAVIVLGGGAHVDQEAAHPWLRGEKAWLRERLDAGAPLLGVCLGAQLLAEVASGGAHAVPAPEIGWKAVELLPAAAEDPLLAGLPARFISFQWHSYEVELPPGAAPLARSAACLQAYRLAGARAWGIQFHAEVTRETIAGWLRDYGGDADARAARLDPAAVLAETDGAIDAWTELGRVLATRFLDAAAATRA